MSRITWKRRHTFLALFSALALLTTTNHPRSFRVLAQETPPPDFYVKINYNKTVFYYDEGIDLGVFRRQGKQAPADCSFGGLGQRFQVLRNGKVIKTFPLGPVEMTTSSIFRGVPYRGFSMGISPFDFVSDLEINLKDNYQIRVMCGDEMSEPSEPFHVSPWREPVDGLQVLIRPVKKEYRVGELILVAATMRNLGTRPRVCPVPLPDDGYQRTFWTSAPPYWEDRRPMLDDSIYYQRRLGVLKPGESRSAKFPLNHFQAPGIAGLPSFGSRPGKYLVWFTVFFHQEDEDIPSEYRKNIWRGELNTNSIEVIVR